ncbi:MULTISPECIES: thioredoxin fold domain-containing protein [Vibrio]|uniref:thioredoxin fold domain-containing protein n=2 Tax=Vibrionaceae TaxID=641 RepID=UPI00084189CC|nr:MULTISPECIES: thioredoxin fold domain-containing protein [Vibrio]ODM56059.1 hypothetical protein BC455_22645 [Vibrio harveyi]USD58526.1 thioredoxin fold domain-containing protein [Vibrio sp. SCSIO 43155]
MNRKLVLLSTLVSFCVNADYLDQYLLDHDVDILRTSQTQEMKATGLEAIFTSAGLLYVNRKENLIISNGELFTLQKDESNGRISLLSESAYVIDDFLRSIPFKIVAKAENEQAKIQVFTDISCPACRNFHSKVDEFLNYGITVEFILVSRNGPQASPYLQMSSIYNELDQYGALQRAMETGYLPTADKPSTQMLVHQQAALTLGVPGTPSIYYKGNKINNIGPRMTAEAIIGLEESMKLKTGKPNG